MFVYIYAENFRGTLQFVNYCNVLLHCIKKFITICNFKLAMHTAHNIFNICYLHYTVIFFVL
jgi:hypothetical protein